MTRIAWLLIGVWAALALARSALQVTNGLSAEYFTNERFAGTPAVATIDPVVSTEQIDAAWVGDPPPTFSARWLGHVTIGRPGLYTFATRSDDGSRLWIDDRLVVDNSGEHVPLTRAARIQLDAGAHRVWIEYEQDGGGYEMALLWAPGDGAPVAVPSWMLSPQRLPLWKIRVARGLDWLRSAVLALALACVLWIALRSARSIAGGVRRVPRAAALAFFVAIAVLETWPLARHPARLSRNDNGDTILNEWVLAWVAHQAPRAPLHVYDANIFYPERNTLAYSESMIVQSGTPSSSMFAEPTRNRATSSIGFCVAERPMRTRSSPTSACSRSIDSAR